MNAQATARAGADGRALERVERELRDALREECVAARETPLSEEYAECRHAIEALLRVRRALRGRP